MDVEVTFVQFDAEDVPRISVRSLCVMKLQPVVAASCAIILLWDRGVAAR